MSWWLRASESVGSPVTWYQVYLLRYTPSPPQEPGLRKLVFYLVYYNWRLGQRYTTSIQLPRFSRLCAWWKSLAEGRRRRIGLGMKRQVLTRIKDHHPVLGLTLCSSRHRSTPSAGQHTQTRPGTHTQREKESRGFLIWQQQ